MIRWVVEFSIRRRWVVIGLAGLVGLLGALAIRDIPVDAIPDLSEDEVVIATDWPGHGPREVEDGLTYPLALELQGLKGVTAIRSSSDFALSTIHVILADGVGTAEGRRRVSERLARASASLPDGVIPRLGPDAPATGQIFWYTVEGGGLDLARLREVQDSIVKPRLSSVPGVAEVASVGGFTTEYEVAIDPDRLRAEGISLAEVSDAVARSNRSAGGASIAQGRGEFLVRGVGWLGSSTGRGEEVVRDLEQVILPTSEGKSLRLSDIARVSLAGGPRRGVLEKDGSEAVGGVVLMATGENPREVTARIRDRLKEIAAGLPSGVRIVPFYDRTPLIDGALGTVRATIVEAMITASVCVVLILLHVRTAFVIAATLPLAALGSFALMWLVRRLGIADIQTNILSMSGIAISIGILVDSSIVMAENVLHRLRERFGDRPATGDLRPYVLPACLEVARPIFFSVAIMILSFLPVFSLGGIEGKFFRPLAFTKTFALIAVSLLSITLVPALCTIFVRGRLRREEDSPIVRGVVEVYRPTLSSLLDNPAPLAFILGITFIVGFAPIGSRTLTLGSLFVAILACGLLFRSLTGRIASLVGLVLIALVADSKIEPLGREFLTPLDEGMVMDMPITVPRVAIAETLDDLKARDMMLCRFPEVAMVVGKGGRAETATDPAPIDMIETMVEFHPRDFWPRRKLSRERAEKFVALTLDRLKAAGLVVTPRSGLVEESVMAVLPLFDTQMREFSYYRTRDFLRENRPSLGHDHGASSDLRASLWQAFTRGLDRECQERGADLLARLAVEDLALRGGLEDPEIRVLREIRDRRDRPATVESHHHKAHHGGEMSRPSQRPNLPPTARLDSIQESLAKEFRSRLSLTRKDRSDLVGFGSDLDRAVSMPGWTNIWTMPIQNRVDMLSTGVNTAVGVRVLGRSPEDVALASDTIAAELKRVPGAADVVSDPIRGKGYLEILPDRLRAASLGVSIADITDAVEIALGGRVATVTVEGRDRRPVRVRLARDFRQDLATIRKIPVIRQSREGTNTPRSVRLEEVATIRLAEGPATIRGEDGALRNYVRMNVRGRGVVDFVAQARRVVSDRVKLPDGVSVSWTGQFEHEERASLTLSIVVPIVIAVIFLLLWWTYHDLADAVLMLLAVPGALAGGVFCQWLMGFPFTVTAWVGYIACFGMATSTGIIMLVYLRESVFRRGGLVAIDLDGLRAAVLDGAAQRLRPKLLTEGTTILGLAPMLWAEGPGSEVIRPMAAPVLGGLLVADEVIDLFLPVLFYHVQKWRWNRLHGAIETSAVLSLAAIDASEKPLA